MSLGVTGWIMLPSNDQMKQSDERIIVIFVEEYYLCSRWYSTNLCKAKWLLYMLWNGNYRCLCVYFMYISTWKRWSVYIYSHIPDIISITLCLRKWINQYFCDRLRRNASQNVSSNSLWCQRDRQKFIIIYSQHEVIVPYRCTWSFIISVSSVLSFVDYVLHTLWKKL